MSMFERLLRGFSRRAPENEGALPMTSSLSFAGREETEALAIYRFVRQCEPKLLAPFEEQSRAREFLLSLSVVERLALLSLGTDELSNWQRGRLTVAGVRPFGSREKARHYELERGAAGILSIALAADKMDVLRAWHRLSFARRQLIAPIGIVALQDLGACGVDIAIEVINRLIRDKIFDPPSLGLFFENQSYVPRVERTVRRA